MVSTGCMRLPYSSYEYIYGISCNDLDILVVFFGFQKPYFMKHVNHINHANCFYFKNTGNT